MVKRKTPEELGFKTKEISSQDFFGGKLLREQQFKEKAMEIINILILHLEKDEYDAVKTKLTFEDYLVELIIKKKNIIKREDKFSLTELTVIMDSKEFKEWHHETYKQSSLIPPMSRVILFIEQNPLLTKKVLGND